MVNQINAFQHRHGTNYVESDLDRTKLLPSAEGTRNAQILHLKADEPLRELVGEPVALPQGAWWQRLGLGAKSTLLALALSTLPVLGIGALAYQVVSFKTQQLAKNSQALGVMAMADKVSRFMFERYGDVQVLTKLPALRIAKVRDITSVEEKQDVLDAYIQSYQVYDNIAVLDLKGNVIVQSTGTPIPNQKDHPFFRQVERSEQPYISQPIPNLDNPKQKTPYIYFAAPVQDATSGDTIAIIRLAMSTQHLDNLLADYERNGNQYHLIDSSGTFFAATEKEQIGRKLQADFPGLQSLQAQRTEGVAFSVDRISGAHQLVGYAPSKSFPGLPNLQWEYVLATNEDVALAAQRNLLWVLGLGTVVAAFGVGTMTAVLARRAIKPILATVQTVTDLGQGHLDARVAVQGRDEIADLGKNINHMAVQLQELIKQQQLQTEQARLFNGVTASMRRTLKFDSIIQTGVYEIRSFLKADRVIMYRFNEDYLSGVVIAESVVNSELSLLNEVVEDCLSPGAIERYANGRLWICDDVQTAGLTDCHRELLERLKIRSNMIAPIVRNGKPLMLLCAQQALAPRRWQDSEIDLFRQVASQIGFALEQAQLLEETDLARQLAETLEQEQRQKNDLLQRQLASLLIEVEGAAQGDLTVRADVTVGEIGTVADFFNSIVESLRQIVTNVKESALRVNTSIGENEQSIQLLAQDSLRQAEEMTLALAALETMRQSILEVAASADQTVGATRTASDTAAESRTAMDSTVNNILSLRETIGETTKKVKRLGESSQKISKVISLINQIAMQTNLLAINAGIEAARAGEEGQGFAVVAEEVGELAARSAAATKEIEHIVETIQRETSEVVNAMELGTAQVVDGTRSVEDTKHSLEKILAVFDQIDQLVQSISEATVSQVQTSQTIDGLIQQVAQISEHTSTSSRQVSSALLETVAIAQELQASVNEFKVA